MVNGGGRDETKRDLKCGKRTGRDHGLPWSTGFKISDVGASGQGASELPALVMGLRRLISLSLASTNVACW